MAAMCGSRLRTSAATDARMLYRGPVPYADAAMRQRIAVGRRPDSYRRHRLPERNIITVGGLAAQITSIAPMEITAIALPSAAGAIGNS